jgi:hypothetical protein
MCQKGSRKALSRSFSVTSTVPRTSGRSGVIRPRTAARKALACAQAIQQRLDDRNRASAGDEVIAIVCFDNLPPRASLTLSGDRHVSVTPTD